MAAIAEMAAAATSGCTGSYCRGQMPRVDDEQKGAKRKKKRQEIEEQKKNIFSRFSFRETASASDWLPPDFLSRQRPTDLRAEATSRRCDSRRAAKKKFRRRFVFLGRGRSQLTRRLGAKKGSAVSCLGRSAASADPRRGNGGAQIKKKTFRRIFGIRNLSA